MSVAHFTDYTIHTDGACSGNPGPGGWAALALARDPQDDPDLPRIRGELAGGHPDATNNQMELTAVLEALRREPEDYSRLRLTIHSDSEYVVKAFNDGWIDGWQRKGWRNSKGREVANKQLWQTLVALVKSRPGPISFNWVKGHNGDPMNEAADRKAVLYSNHARRATEPFIEGTLIFHRPEPPTIVEGSARELNRPELPAPSDSQSQPELPAPAESEPAPTAELTTAETFRRRIDPALSTLSQQERDCHTLRAINEAGMVDRHGSDQNGFTVKLRFADRSQLLLRLQCSAAEVLPGG